VRPPPSGASFVNSWTSRKQSPLVSNPRSVALHLWRRGGGGDDFHRFHPLVGNHLARMVGSLDLYWVCFGKQPRYKESFLFGRTYLASPLVLGRFSLDLEVGRDEAGFQTSNLIQSISGRLPDNPGEFDWQIFVFTKKKSFKEKIACSDSRTQEKN